MNSIYKGRVIALEPIYIRDKGDVTILYKEGKHPILIEKSIKSCLKNMCKYYIVDYIEIRERYKGHIHSADLVPISLSKDNIFTPFKTRLPCVKNDCAYSYINYHFIKCVKEKNGKAIVCLKNGINFPCLFKKSTAEKHYKDAHIINKCYNSIGMTSQ